MKQLFVQEYNSSFQRSQGIFLHFNMSTNRIALFLKYAEIGPLSALVALKLNTKKENSTPAGNFKELYAKSKPGPDRENLVYNAVIKQGKPSNLVPISIDLPGGGKLTYYTMPDYIEIDGIRTMVSGQTAQKIADHFNMILPTRPMSKQIYSAADGKAYITPFSASGFTDNNGKYWDAKQFTLNKIGDGDSSIAFNDNINQAFKGKNFKLKAGFMKDITQPSYENKLGLYGLYYKDKPIQDTISSPHDTKYHTEYISGLRLVDNKIKITLPNGSTKETTINEAIKDPVIANILANPGSNSIQRYKL